MVSFSIAAIILLCLTAIATVIMAVIGFLIKDLIKSMKESISHQQSKIEEVQLAVNANYKDLLERIYNRNQNKQTSS